MPRWKLSLKMPYYLILLMEQWEERAGGKRVGGWKERDMKVRELQVTD